VANVVLYTAIFGGKDELLEPIAVEEGVDYVCFTDDDTIKSDTYRVVHTNRSVGCPNLTAKEYKFFPHKFVPGYDISIWMDGNHTPVEPVVPLAKHALKKHKIAFFKHPERDCLYEEAKVCARYGREDPKKIVNQVAAYKDQGMPRHMGLARGGVIFRRNDPHVEQAMQIWWEHALTFSKRDQISFPFVAWITGLRFGILDSKLYTDHFDMKHHVWFNESDDRKQRYKNAGRTLVFKSLRKAGKMK
jgi:hypothetical protein